MAGLNVKQMLNEKLDENLVDSHSMVFHKFRRKQEISGDS